MTVLVVDHGHSTVCGIHDLGVRIADRLGAVHVDCNSHDEYVNAWYHNEASVVIVNYRSDLMPWWRPMPFTAVAVLHNYSPDTVDQRASELLARGFDHVLVLDPTVQPSDPRVHAVGRPIPDTWKYSSYDDHDDYPYIGSFGFAFPHKGFVDVASEVASLGRAATFNLHMPEAYFNGAQGQQLYTAGIVDSITAELSNHEVRLVHTNDHIDGPALVQRLAQNDVNCLFYHPGQPDAGLSSALDYLIAARRPIMVTDCAMFAHADGYAATWPHHHLADVLDNYDAWQQRADMLYEQTVNRFATDMTAILDSL